MICIFFPEILHEKNTSVIFEKNVLIQEKMGDIFEQWLNKGIEVISALAS